MNDMSAGAGVCAQFGETLAGVSTIRSYRDGERFQDANTALIEANETAWYCYCACNRWLGYRLDILGTTIAFVTTLISVTQVRIALSKRTRWPSKVTAIVVRC